MKLSPQFIQDFKGKINLLELVQEYTDMHLYNIDNWCGLCPHPDHNDTLPSFHVYKEKEMYRWYCFGCNTGGDVIDFIQWINNYEVTWIKAIKFLANKYHISLPEDKYNKEYKQNRLILNKYKKDTKERAWNYLYSRGLNNSDIDKWEIGYDKINDRIVFPLLDIDNNVVGFNKRLIGNDKTKSKYINSKKTDIFKKSSYLYGLNHIDKKEQYIIITEGVMDVILSTKYGLKNVVCTLGTALTQHHIPILKSFKKTIVLVYDGDEPGKKAINKAAQLLLNNDIYCKTVFLPAGKDLADMSLEYKKEIKKYIESEMCTYGYYNAKSIIDNYNKELYELQLRYQPMLNQIIKNIPKQEKNTIQCFIEKEIGLKAVEL